MEQITIHIRDARKAKALENFLKSLDYVEKVTTVALRDSSASRARNADFFALAGIWAGRDITLETLLYKAWPKRI
jgi:hypothetical protein